MRLLFGVSFYAPHLSGLTLHVQRLAEGMAKRGHQVMVLTHRHDPALSSREELNGVDIVRLPVWLRISKALLAPTLMFRVPGLIRRADLVVLNLPGSPFDLVTALLTRMTRKPLATIYHCDLNLPGGFWNRCVDYLSAVFSRGICILSKRIVAYTEDYARHSHTLSRFLHKVEVISPPVKVSKVKESEVEEFRRKHAPRDEYLLGFAGRFSSEKGVEVVMDALSSVHEAVGPVRVLFAGPYKGVVGEDHYYRYLRGRIEELGDQWAFLGSLEGNELATFYAGCDVLVLPSLNRTESFGLVQVESMLCGTPVVASSLPGVRVPITKTGMGITVTPGSSEELAGGVIRVLRGRDQFRRDRDFVEGHFSLEESMASYSRLFRFLTGGPLAKRRSIQKRD